MPQGTMKSKKSKKDREDESQEQPSAQERTASGIKLAKHLQTAFTGGKIRQAFALWGAARQLRVAAAGTGGLMKRHPVAAAVLGGTLAGTAIYFAAKSAAATDEDEAGEEQGEDEEARDQAQGRDDEAESDEDEDGGQEPGNNHRHARHRAGAGRR